MRIAFNALMGFLFLTTCALAQQETGPANPLDYPGRQIIVRSGGGFTGGVKSYHLTDDGYLYFRQGVDSTYKPLGKRKLSTVQKTFATLETTCKIQQTEFKHPGNLYYSVAWKQGKTEHEVVWGDPQHPAPASYRQFYRTFMDLVKTGKK